MNSNPDCCGLHRDAKYLCEKNRDIADSLGREIALETNEALLALYDLTSALTLNCRRKIEHPEKASTPLSRTTRELSNTTDWNSHPTPQPENLIVATFGWWEIISPNPGT